DTGSTDSTQAIARRFGARVHQFEWCDDFSAARNEALRHSRGAWILYIDADERVRATSRRSLYQLLRRREAVAYHVQRRLRDGLTPVWEMGLFRNDPRIRFEGVVHENIWPGIYRYRAAEGGLVGHSELAVDHVGDDGSPERKHQFYLPLLLKELERNPDNVYCWCHLGMIYRGLGRPDSARETWWSAVAVVRRRGVRAWVDSMPYVRLLQFDLVAGREFDALLAESLSLFPTHPHLLCIRGYKRMSQGRNAEAAEDFTRLTLWHAEHGGSKGSMGYNELLFGALPRKALAVCLFRLGRCDEARYHYELATQPSSNHNLSALGPVST